MAISLRDTTQRPESCHRAQPTAESPGSSSAGPEPPLPSAGPRSSWNKTQAAAAYINRGGAAAAPIASASASRGSLVPAAGETGAGSSQRGASRAAEPPGPAWG